MNPQMFTEEYIKSKLDGHFWKMFVGEYGSRVVDINHERPPFEERVQHERKKVGPHFIEWEKHDEMLMQMRRAGAQFKEIARVLGVNKDSVRWRFHRLCAALGVDPDQEGPSFKKFNPQIEAEIVALRDQGMTFQKIGERFGLSKASVCTLYYRWYRRTHKEAA